MKTTQSYQFTADYAHHGNMIFCPLTVVWRLNENVKIKKKECNLNIYNKCSAVNKLCVIFCFLFLAFPMPFDEAKMKLEKKKKIRRKENRLLKDFFFFLLSEIFLVLFVNLKLKQIRNQYTKLHIIKDSYTMLLFIYNIHIYFLI